MNPYYADESVTLHRGDCMTVMAAMPKASVDAIVTDPPYGLGFMGKEWDDLPPGRPWAQHCFRVLKPGGHLLAFGGTRTWHRLACAIEDAGFQLRDSIAWLHGQGFPKGKGQLKPAFEPVIVARKPGPIWLNIDGCRVPGTYDSAGRKPQDIRGGNFVSGPTRRVSEELQEAHPAGRWPTNVLLDGDTADELDRQSGVLKSGDLKPYTARAGDRVYNHGLDRGDRVKDYTKPGDSGGASRFFPVFQTEDGPTLSAGPSGECLPRPCDRLNTRDQSSFPAFCYEPKAPPAERPRIEGVAHPTVKPLDLMRWLVRLVTPPGGTVLDPFAGSGTTAEACVVEGFRCIAVEREAAYLPLIVARLTKPIQPDLFGGAA